VRGVKEGEYE
jgi:hypothetical protein